MKNKYLDKSIGLIRKFTSSSILDFGRIFFKHYLTYDPSRAHKEIYNILFEITHQRGKKVAIAAPRGFGKSTLVTVIYVLYCICYQKEKFIIILSNSSSQAVQMLSNIKKELLENVKLRKLFPEVCKPKTLSKSIHWQKDSIITPNGVHVLALGLGQRIRGRRSGAERPSLIIADDLENPQNTFSPDSREKIKHIFETSILMAGDEKTNYIFLGNLYHPHCLLSEYLSEDKKGQWIQLRYSAIEKMPERMDLWEDCNQIYNGQKDFEGKNGPEAAEKYYLVHQSEMDKGAVLLWPKRYKLYDLMVMYGQNEYSFLSEMQNMPLDPKQIIFNIDEFYYWDDNGKTLEDLFKSLGNELEFYGACDPSLNEDSSKGSYSAIVILVKAKGNNNKTLYVITADIKRRRIEEIVDGIVAYATRYPFVKFGIEVNGFQKVMIDLVKDKARELNIKIPLKAIDNRGNKISRIQALSCLTKAGSLQFSKKSKQLLEEFLYFPKGKSFDGLDALEMAVSLVNSLEEVDVTKMKKIFNRINKKDPNKFFIQGGQIIPNYFGLLKVK